MLALFFFGAVGRGVRGACDRLSLVREEEEQEGKREVLRNRFRFQKEGRRKKKSVDVVVRLHSQEKTFFRWPAAANKHRRGPARRSRAALLHSLPVARGLTPRCALTRLVKLLRTRIKAQRQKMRRRRRRSFVLLSPPPQKNLTTPRLNSGNDSLSRFDWLFLC